MDTVVLVARLVLAAIFITAAVGKLLDLKESRESLVGFGVPQPMAAVAGTLLPFAELAVAIALIPRSSATAGAIGALVLLLAFVAGIGNALRRGEAPSCNCFGAIHSAPASKTTLARNVALAAVAVFALAAGPGPALDTWVDARTSAELVAVALGIVSILLAVVGIPAWLENRRLHRDLDAATTRLKNVPRGLRVGSLAPEFSLPDGEGGTLTLDAVLDGGRRPAVLIFTLAGCGPCEPLLPDLRRLQAAATDRLGVGLVGVHTIEHYDAMRQRHGGDLKLADAIVEDPDLLREMERVQVVMGDYDVHLSPTAVVVTSSGTIGSTFVSGRPAIEALIRRTLAVEAPPLALTAGV